MQDTLTADAADWALDEPQRHRLLELHVLLGIGIDGPCLCIRLRDPLFCSHAQVCRLGTRRLLQCWAFCWQPPVVARWSTILS